MSTTTPRVGRGTGATRSSGSATRSPRRWRSCTTPTASPHADVLLGAAYEGPPGLVHGGVSALLLDQVMGETASGFRRVTMTGTLTLRYRRGTPLGPLRVEARIASESGRKVTVEAHIAAPDGQPTVEATGLFIVPRWALSPEAEQGWSKFAEG